MVSDQFRKDYRQMTAKGVELTPEDVVRLNALMVKVRLSQNAARTTHLPRLAFLQARRRRFPFSIFHSQFFILREPTIAHELWLEQAQRYIEIDCDRTFDLLYGYALSRPAEKLPDAFNPHRLVRKVFTFAARHLAHLTREQLSASVDYVLFGADWTACENGPKKEDKGSTVNINLRPQPPSPTIGLLTEARAIRLPISIDDAKSMTASELDEAIFRAMLKDNKIDPDEARKSALGEYVRARNEIMNRKKSRDQEDNGLQEKKSEGD